MSNHEITIDDLRRILRVAAGQDESTDLDGDILDVTFNALGYDSLALLETAGRIEREWGGGSKLDDATIIDAQTPRALLAAVNEQLVAV